MSRFPFPIPWGWFHVGYSRDVASGEVKAVHRFGRELALWRDADGNARLQDAYCPHLGANIARGGRVVGSLIECPFHHWRFDGEGRVKEIAYAKRINEKACLPSYPVEERHGVVMAWYHPQGAAPSYRLPEVPETSDPAWVGPHSTGHRIGTCLQEMAENTADGAHFVTIHKHPGAANYDDFQCVEHMMIMRSTQQFPSSHGPVAGTLNVDSSGFGYATVRYSTLVDICMVTTTVPIDAETSEQHNHVWYRNPQRDPKIDRIGEAFVKEVNRQLTDDIPIWENKIYLESPNLCDGDGPIARFRRWAQQFYVAA
jgi:nitrite reductase/ring-hydroxylating ferredoxin subunit